MNHCVALAACLSALLVCGCGDDPLDKRAARLEARMAAPGMSLYDIAHYATDLGERYERAERWPQAAEQYRRAVWALEYAGLLTGREPPLLADARASLARARANVPESASRRAQRVTPPSAAALPEHPPLQ